ncbi:uncharacterized protein LOC144130019 [Amblyomma americanum]
MQVFAVAALCLIQATCAERSFHDILSPLGGYIIETPPRHVAIATAKMAAARNSSYATTVSTNADDQDSDDQRGLGHPCTRDGDCVAGRGLSCQEWVCSCAPDSPVTVRVQGVDTCLPAKSLYEACRYHQECSHRSANMRCVDFLCYCPLPFELHGNGDCLEPKPVAGKIIAAVTPTTILVVVMAALGGTFLFRRAFANAEDKDSCYSRSAHGRQGQRPRNGSMAARSKVPSTSISVRTGPLKSLRPKKPGSNLYSQSHEASSLPATRLIRVPPDRQRPNAFSPGPASTTTAMQTSSFTPPVPFEKSSLALGKSALSAVPPAPLSSARLIDKLLSSSVDLPDEEDISVRVLKDNRPAQHPWFSKVPHGDVLTSTASNFQKRAILPFTKGESSRVDDGSSLPIEWGTLVSNRECHGNRAVLDQSTRHEQGSNGAKDDASGLTLFSSFRQSKNVTFLDCTLSDTVHADRKLDEEKPAGQLCTARAGYEHGMRVSSLKAETRWLYQSERPPATQQDVPLGECQQSGRSEPQSNEQPRVAAGAKGDNAQTRTEEPLTWGERNRLGVGTPFVDIEEGSLAESASIPLSFLSPISPSFEVLPKPDISSGMLREADALLHSAQDGATAGTQEREDTSLVAEFVGAVGSGKPSSDSTAPLRFSGPVASGNGKDRSSVVGHKETTVGTSTRPPSAGQATAQPAGISTLPPQQTWPAVVNEVARQGATPNKTPKPTGDTADGREGATAGERRQDESKPGEQAPQPEEGTSSYSDIENLAEILTSLKVTQLGNEHLRRERTLLRDYGGIAPILPGLPAALQWPRATTVAASPAVVLSAGTAATMPAAQRIVPPSRSRPATPASEQSPTGPPKVAATPVLPPLKESSEDAAELAPSGEGSDKCTSSELRTPAQLRPQSTGEEAGRDWEDVSVTTGALHRRHPSVAELHRERTPSNQRSSPATSSSSRPVPLKRSIRFRRTSASRLQTVPETIHVPQPEPAPTPLPRKTPTQGEGERIGNVPATKEATVAPSALQSDSQQTMEAERASRLKKATKPSASPEGAPPDFTELHGASPRAQAHVRAANVRSEPLRGRSPFVMRKHFSEPINPKELEAATTKASRSQSRSSTSAFRSSDLASMNTGSSSVAGYDNAYDTDALIPSSIPTVTATSAGEPDESSYDATLSPFLYGLRLLPECELMPAPEASSDAASATTEEANLLSTLASSTPRPRSSGNAASLVPPPTPRRSRQRESVERESSAVVDSAASQESGNAPSYGDFGTTSTTSRPIPLPRRLKNILSSSIASVTRATWGTTAPVRAIATETADASAATSTTARRRSTTRDGSSTSRYTRKTLSRQSRSKAKREKRNTTRPSQCSSRAERETPLGRDTESMATSVRTPPLFSPSMSFPVSTTDTLASCGAHRSRKHDLVTSTERDDAARATTTSVLGESSSRLKSKHSKKTAAAATRKRSSLPRFFFGRHRESEGGDDASSVPSESSCTTDGLRLSAIMAKLGILPSHRLFASSATDAGLSLEAALPSRHGAGDRGGHSSNDDDATSRALFTQSEASSRLPRVWPESSTSFSVAETSEPDSFLVDDSCAEANNSAACERGASRYLQARRDGTKRGASPRGTAIRDAFRGLMASPDPEWFSCSSRISDRPARPFSPRRGARRASD